MALAALAAWALVAGRWLNLRPGPRDDWGSADRIRRELRDLRERRERPAHWPPRVTRRPKLDPSSYAATIRGPREEYVFREPRFTFEAVRWWLAWGPDTFPVGATHRQAFDRDIPLETPPNDAPGLEALANRVGLAAEARLLATHDPDVAPVLAVEGRPVQAQADGDPRGRTVRGPSLQDAPLRPATRSGRLDLGVQ
jgi:hypothetical protein